MEVLQELREAAAQFATERLRPNLERWDREREVEPAVYAQLAELGFHGLLVPEDHGGLGLGPAGLAAVLEEIAWGEPVLAYALLASAAAAATLARTDGQDRAATLEALATGGLAGAMQLAAGTGLRATRADDGWVLDGTAEWLLETPGPNLRLLAAALPNDRGVGLFPVGPGAAGLEEVGRETTLGLRAARIGTVRVAGVRVAGAAALTDGNRVAEVETVQRIGTAAIALGIARAAFEHARGYADVREQFGRRLRMFEGIQAKLAVMDTRIAAGRALLAASAQSPTPAAAARAKIFTSETAMEVTTQAVQIFGGYGYMRDYPVEKTMRDAKATEILTGTNEALRRLIAATLYQD